MLWPALIFGAVVGFSLGLTGGGGAIFAVPLLVYGMGTTPADAVGISLAAVGITAAIGFLVRLRHGQVEIRTGLWFALAGMLGAPIGAWLAGWIPPAVLLTLFALLMLLVAARMWRQAARSAPAASLLPPPDAAPEPDGPSCRRDEAGNLLLTSRCAVVLMAAGLLAGMLSGLFGVGGGFVIVPALILFSGMGIQRAVGTSLLVIALVAAVGVGSHLWAGRTIQPGLPALFAAGGVAGLLGGHALGSRLPANRMQRTFALAMLGVAAWMLVHTLWIVPTTRG